MMYRLLNIRSDQMSLPLANNWSKTRISKRFLQSSILVQQCTTSVSDPTKLNDSSTEPTLVWLQVSFQWSSQETSVGASENGGSHPLLLWNQAAFPESNCLKLRNIYLMVFAAQEKAWEQRFIKFIWSLKVNLDVIYGKLYSPPLLGCFLHVSLNPCKSRALEVTMR